MRRIDAIVFRQAKDLGVHILIETLGTALLEIGAPATTDQQRVPGEHTALLLDDVAHAAVGVAGRGQRIDRVSAEIDAIPLRDMPIRLGSTGRCNHRLAAR